MKQILLIATVFLSTFVFSAEIKSTFEKVNFTHGTFDAIVVNIPYGNQETIEKQLRSEMKDWGGKYDSKGDEYYSKASKMKAMGDKYFDGYAKIIKKGEEYQVAFAVDLGGTYLTPSGHPAQYKVIEKRALKFAKEASTKSIEDEIEIEAKALSALEKEQKSMEGDIEESKKNIENYKKKISEEEEAIKKNESDLTTKKTEITKQTEKLAEIKKRLK